MNQLGNVFNIVANILNNRLSFSSMHNLLGILQKFLFTNVKIVRDSSKVNILSNVYKRQVNYLFQKHAIRILHRLSDEFSCPCYLEKHVYILSN